MIIPYIDMYVLYNVQTPTFAKDQPAQHDEPQQQQHCQQQQDHSQKKQQYPQHLGTAGLQTAQGRHRLANISNLPPSPASAMASAAAAPGSPQQPDSCGLQAMQTGGTTGRAKRQHHVLFKPGEIVLETWQ